jgi:hypothetical protein
MKRMLTTSLIIAALLASISYGAQANNDGSGNFTFNCSSGVGCSGEPYHNVQFGETWLDDSSMTWNSNATWTTNVNANDMTVSIQDFSFSVSYLFSGSIEYAELVWIPPITDQGLGNRPGYWERHLIGTKSYSCSCQLSGSSDTSRTTPIESSSPYGPFHYNLLENLEGSYSITGTLNIGDETIPFSVNDLDFHASDFGGYFITSDYPNSLGMQYGGGMLNGEKYVIYKGSFYGKPVTVLVPEPCTLALLALGGVLLRKRRG